MRLSLYHSDACAYCYRVRFAARRLGVELELRDARGVPEHVAALRSATGSSRVPVLRIERDDGTVQWLPESREIVRWLERHAAERAPR